MMMKRLVVAAAALGTAMSASAATTTYSDSASFAAAVSTAAFIDFEGESEGSRGLSWTTGGTTIDILPGGHANLFLYVSPPGTLANPAAPDSTTLAANGDENFRFELSDGSSFTAIGFDVLTNSYDAPVVSLYDVNGDLIEAVTLTQGPISFGFFGITSTTAISYATFIVDRGWVENAAIDNVRIGDVAPVPEPSEWAMIAAGLGIVGAAARRRRRRG